MFVVVADDAADVSSMSDVAVTLTNASDYQANRLGLGLVVH